jgi:hypothetical protein
MNARFKLSVGQAAVECEGSESFVREAFPELFDQALTKLMAIPITRSGSENLDGDEVAGFLEGRMQENGSMSVSMFASRIACASGPDLILAAAAKLCLSDGLRVFPRRQLLEEMKSATAYYRDTYSGNLSKYLGQLVRDGQLNEVRAGHYALSAAATERIRNQGTS